MVRLDVLAVGTHAGHAAAEIEEQRSVVGVHGEGDDGAASVCLAAFDQLELELVAHVLDSCRSRFGLGAVEDIASLAAVRTHRGWRSSWASK